MKVITIGQASNNDVVISNDPQVSSTHCQIIQDDNGKFLLIDFDSTSGTFRSGQRINGEVPLGIGDVVRIGNTSLPWQSYFQIVPGNELNSALFEEEREKTEQADKNILYGTLWLAGGLIVTLMSYSAAVGGGTYIATYGAIVYGAFRLLGGLFSKKKSIGFIGLGLLIAAGFGLFQLMRHLDFNAEVRAQQTFENQVFDKLNSADMTTIHIFNNEHLSITIPNNMIREIEDSTKLDIIERYWTGNNKEDIFRVSIERLLKSDVRDDINNLADFVSVLQEPDSLRQTTYTEDTSNIKCLADKNGYNSFYYCEYSNNLWGKVLYSEDKNFYYLLTVWTHPDYKDRLNDLIDSVVSSFDINK